MIRTVEVLLVVIGVYGRNGRFSKRGLYLYRFVTLSHQKFISSASAVQRRRLGITSVAHRQYRDNANGIGQHIVMTKLSQRYHNGITTERRYYIGIATATLLLFFESYLDGAPPIFSPLLIFAPVSLRRARSVRCDSPFTDTVMIVF